MDVVAKLFSMLVILLGIFIAYKYTMEVNRHPQIPLKGFTVSRLHSIRQILRELLEDEPEGLALAVIHKGEIVADMWAGYADKSSDRQWERHTLTCAYSSTKIFGGLIAAKMVTEGMLRYDEKVVKYWPQFNEFGKEALSVQDILEHKSGLVAFHREFSVEEATQPAIISRIIEKSKPLWKPGRKIGYHAITYGFLIDQLLRRADSKHRSIAEIFEEDVKQHSKDKDFFIGLPMKEEYRVARISNPPLLASLIAYAKRPLRFAEIMYKYWRNGGIASISASYPHILRIMGSTIPYNDPKIHRLENIGSLGIGSARGMASTIATFFQHHLINDTLQQLIAVPVEYEDDLVLMQSLFRGYGFFYRQHPVRENAWTIYHAGNGGQMVEIDPQQEIVIVLLRNGLRAGSDVESLYWRVSDHLFNLLLPRMAN